MKIVQLITHMNELGGAQVHVRDLSKQLIEDGHSVTILSGGDSIIDQKLRLSNLTYMHSKHLVRNINMKKDIKAFADLRRKLKKLQPDLVAIHSSKAGILGRLVCWSLKIPFVFTAHGWAFTVGVDRRQARLYQIIEKWIGVLSPKIITVCEHDRQLAINHSVLPPSKMTTIHNGVPDQRLSQEERVTQTVTIAMIARFEVPKKHLELLKILAQLEEYPWRLVLVGEGSLKQEAVEYVNNHGLKERVDFLDSHTNIHQVLKHADIFVLTSSWEGLPLSILEAMVHGLPIIALDVGGVSEIVRDRDNGFLVRDNLREALITLLTDRSLRMEMGKRSREIYEKEFTCESMYQKTISLYLTLKKSEARK